MIADIAGCEPITFGFRHAERRILHSQWSEDAIAQEFAKRRAGDTRDQHAQNFRSAVVKPALAGLIKQRQAAVALHQFIRREGTETPAPARSPPRQWPSGSDNDPET